MSELTESAIKKLKVNELKAELSKRGLAVKGKKDELIKRLLDALEEDGEEEDVDAESSDDEEEEPMEGDTENAGDTSQEQEDTDSQSKSASQPDVTEEPEQTDEAESVETIEPEPATDDSSDDDTPLISAAVDEKIELKTDEPAEEPMATEDFVIVKKPPEDVAEDIEKAAEAQDAVLEEQEVTEGKGESMDTTEPVKTEKSPKKRKESVTSEKVSKETDVKESPRKSRTEKEVKDTEKTSEKPAKVEEKEKEPKKEPEIIDTLAEVEDEECEVSEDYEISSDKVVLDPYSSDINFVITNNGVNGHSLTKNGFSFMWAGARATKGAKGGKIGYELKVISSIKTDLPENEAPINAVRIGWSSENSNIQLGESSLSYGFESTGKVCASSSFFEYGEKFGEGDVIGTYLDLESEPKTLRYTKNGIDLGVAMSLTVNLEEKPLFPHVFLRNMKVEFNFGVNEEPWFPTLEGYTLIQNASADNTTDNTSEPPTELSDCDVHLLVGLPSAGKTYWVKKHVDSHPSKHYNVIGIKYIMDRCRLEGKHRKKSDPNASKLMKATITILTKLFHLCPKKKRNYIFDQNNVYKVAQETKMNLFEGFKRNAVVIVPTHDNLRRRTSDSKRSRDNMVEIPFGDLCDMKCEFHIPEVGELFDEVTYPELDEKNASKTIRDYKTDGSRAKRTGRDDNYPGGKRKRYEEQRSGYSGGRRDNRFSGGRDASRRDEGWKNSGSGYGGYDSSKNRSNYGSSYGGSSGGYKRMDNKPSYNDPYRRNSGGGYRQQSYGSGSYGTYGGGNTGGGYRGGSNYGSGSYGSSGGYSSGGGYNQSNRGGNWGGQYGSSQNQSQQWGSGGNWGSYNYNNSGNNYGGGNYSY